MKKNVIKFVHIGYGRFILVIMPVINKGKVKRARAVLHLEKYRSIGDFSNKMELIRVSIRNNPASFPAPPVSVADNAQFDNDIKAMNSSETTALTKATGASTARDVDKEQVLTDVHQLQGYVQSLADLLKNTLKAVALIELSGFDVSLKSPYSKSDFTAKRTKISGQIKLAINVKKMCEGERRYSVKWQSSPDAGKTPADLPTTIKGSTLVSGLAPGIWMWFRFLVVLKDGEHSWSAWISVLVE